MKRTIGLEAIIDYKLFKAAAEIVLGIVVLVFLMRGAEAGAATLAQFVIDHVSGGWGLRAAKAIVVTGTTRHLKVAAMGAFADAILSAIEGLALRAGRWWAPWLVVTATGSFLPWEVMQAARRPGWLRIGILLINVAVVVYLVRQVARERRPRPRPGGPSPDSQAHA